MWDNLGLKEVVEYANDPYPSIRKWAKDKGKRVVGSTIADVPEEVIHAFGLLPVALIGTQKPLKKAPSRLPDNACSLARSNLELVMSYEGDLFDGFVLPQVCDTTQHLSDIWRITFPGKYVESFLAPRQADRPSARYWVREEIERLITSLSEWTGRSLQSEALQESIRVHNENKTLLKEIYKIKCANPAAITNKEMFSLIKLSMQVDKAEINKSLKKIKDSLNQEKKADGYTDVILVGITCDPPEVYDLFDEVKVNIAGDTLVTGTRYLQGIVPENGEPSETIEEIYGPSPHGKVLAENGKPIQALTERHFRRGFFSPIHDNVYKNFEEIKALYTATNAKAIIYVHIEFCESEEYDLPDLKKMIRKEGIPMHVVDTEYQTTSLSHVRTRLQAFFESLKGGSL
ncbi:2-hydroxyacyl-CoA dehydratase subunit D [Syntrophorhabdus aromaticivorans]|jgi:benzoyl-CoA reductase/2-hydroxyglutaryl-CoA dehydratase subunit BcrC/BadD/HgdB|uniref:2-hydroxyacyl-CoA dehydratase n=1 Tax=Syntrophorhabdus aromaticivorans TaxID=328301 RepID=A0A351U0M6_9BACT|nr:2-hydroxyacyl-CoA dehydratase family protein [Syntrophorhabdus aromaticivorans]NLW34730.1 2-hydroxyacyl-CoA dehydratase [Syntrophorhabdus aromaticivorans]HBA53507.1 2-hydroxyacyl-CoA dehydratase [Syntrophorhabdus aromaticivorans]